MEAHVKDFCGTSFIQQAKAICAYDKLNSTVPGSMAIAEAIAEVIKFNRSASSMWVVKLGGSGVPAIASKA